ncbi:MAG: T9SS type A sorting domain-containing protein [Bacteroidota bacterium]
MKNLFSFLFSLCFLVTHAQISVEWLYKDNEQAYSMNSFYQDVDGNLYSSYQNIILKVNAVGDLLWEKIINLSPESSDIIYNNDFLYFSFWGMSSDGPTFFLAKIDDLGNWVSNEEIISYNSCNYGFTVYYAHMDQYNDSLYLITHRNCCEDIDNINKYDYFMINTTSGEIIHTLSVSSYYQINFYKIISDGIGGIYVKGSSNNSFLKKYDDLFSFIYSYTPVSSSGEYGYVHVFTTDDIGNVYIKVYLPDDEFQFVKLDENGDVLMTINYEHPVSGYSFSIHEMLYQNSKLYVVGKSNETNKPNIFTACFNENGELLWEDTYYTDPDRSGTGSHIFFDEQNNYVYVYGYKSTSYNSNTSDLFMRVYDEPGNILTGFTYNSGGDLIEKFDKAIIDDNHIYIQAISDNHPMVLCLKGENLSISEINSKTFSIFPNPAQYKITVQSNEPIIDKETTIIIRNTLGSVLKTHDLLQQTETINLNLDTGIYLISVESINKKTYTQKLIIN